MTDHATLSEHAFRWSEVVDEIHGKDTWSTIQCARCKTVTFCHEHWDSEDYVEDERGNIHGIDHRDLYPPAPPRIKPPWGPDLLFSLHPKHIWVRDLHNDIYATLGIKAYSLAAMGIRTIVDFVVSSKAGDYGTFIEKLARLRSQGLSQVLEDKTNTAFEAGSAAAHRGYSPSEIDAYVMLDIAEELLQQFYIDAFREVRRKKDADRLKANTPQRIRPPKKP